MLADQLDLHALRMAKLEAGSDELLEKTEGAGAGVRFYDSSGGEEQAT